jgi:hypothetical protein
VQQAVLSQCVERFNLNRAQATVLAACLVDTLENNEDAAAVPPPYDYGDKFARIVAEGLGLDPVVAAKGLGIRGGRGQN